MSFFCDIFWLNKIGVEELEGGENINDFFFFIMVIFKRKYGFLEREIIYIFEVIFIF
jgi:hypothetical protein